MNICPKCNSLNAKTAWLACDLRGERIKTCKDCGCQYTKNYVYDGQKATDRSSYEIQQRNMRK